MLLSPSRGRSTIASFYDISYSFRNFLPYINLEVLSTVDNTLLKANKKSALFPKNSFDKQEGNDARSYYKEENQRKSQQISLSPKRVESQLISRPSIDNNKVGVEKIDPEAQLC